MTPFFLPLNRADFRRYIAAAFQPKAAWLTMQRLAMAVVGPDCVKTVARFSSFLAIFIAIRVEEPKARC